MVVAIRQLQTHEAGRMSCMPRWFATPELSRRPSSGSASPRWRQTRSSGLRQQRSPPGRMGSGHIASRFRTLVTTTRIAVRSLLVRRIRPAWSGAAFKTLYPGSRHLLYGRMGVAPTGRRVDSRISSRTRIPILPRCAPSCRAAGLHSCGHRLILPASRPSRRTADLTPHETRESR